MKRLVIDLDDSLHDCFKAAAAKVGDTMKNTVMRMVKHLLLMEGYSEKDFMPKVQGKKPDIKADRKNDNRAKSRKR